MDSEKCGFQFHSSYPKKWFWFHIKLALKTSVSSHMKMLLRNMSETCFWVQSPTQESCRVFQCLFSIRCQVDFFQTRKRVGRGRNRTVYDIWGEYMNGDGKEITSAEIISWFNPERNHHLSVHVPLFYHPGHKMAKQDRNKLCPQ